jgi:hypothetical protein
MRQCDNNPNPATQDETMMRLATLKTLANRFVVDQPQYANLEQRIRAMAGRWDYPPEMLSEWLVDAQRNPAKVITAVASDERKFGTGSERVKWPQ